MHEVKPYAMLVGEVLSKREALFKIYNGYRRCYSNDDSWLITKSTSVSMEEMEAFVRKMLKAEHAHESPLEHASLTFHLTMSRASSHQLVRHRIASYSQQSQRYVTTQDMPVIVPPKVAASEDAKADFLSHMQACENAYHRMSQYDALAAEDARFLLPTAAATHLVTTMNFRSLLHFFAERCCNRAQWEIRDIANQMLSICKILYPCVFENAGPHCMRVRHCPEAKPCGKQPWREKA